MSDSRRKKPIPKRGRPLTPLTPEQAKVLQARYGIRVSRGVWEESPPPELPTDDEHVCAFCGATEGPFKEIFDGKHDVIICANCLAASDDDEVL